jgi:hypothetical protein
MRTLWIAVVALALTPLVSVAEPPTSTKERLDNLEEDLDKLAQEVEEIGGMACSATQQDNSVLITCGDGTSGVIAGAGTVVLYPEGQIGEVPPIDYNTGPIVAVDATGLTLGIVERFYATEGGAWPSKVRIYLDCAYCSLDLNNFPDTQQVILSYPVSSALHFLSDECSGTPFIADGPTEIGDQLYIPLQPLPNERILFNSIRYAGRTRIEPASNPDEPPEIIYDEPSECIRYTHAERASPAVEYFLAPEIANAAYPVTIEQLPQ